ncbi:SPFH/Band 7/PHB domain protein [Porphyromonas crevioricanis]|uniref:Protein QmcA n=2 Tax=Porphyromonas crevioricanis TaxID=393921 RepID=A0A0A2FCJ0_9PORP|nr:SPFH domain-containing protein [Porphyromonas crevioricanis]KGN88756.1 SPFH/Band 7/PHB domain protein [Porphyromonas crevioricanis]KGN96449.1 SPFH/Band 7/PHB domain protein [Porphyromonas crevioricanis]SJZ94712.1 Regulator of protease activity HflC, stomatin/prohibitin superfamily [Porphyromonas crevioricanis]SQH73627.1 FtsH protease regulator HflK [Porphyromonas crevioricanis]GAD05463.1 putative stomatin/prohibitin-family membrane protease subunit YbbK [Porphyromonas crevioricanis JCM 1590
MNLTIIILVVLVVLAISIVSQGLLIVQQSQTVIVERLGKYYTTLNSGVNIIIPFIDKARPMHWRYTYQLQGGDTMVRFARVNRIDLRETVYDFPKQNVITRDNVVTEINAILYFQIVDPIRAVYEIQNLPDAIEKLTQTSLRNVIGEMDLDETLTSRDTINSKLREILDEATNKWGVKVNRVELQDINPPRDIRDAMEKQMRAERDKRAQILQAEGQKEAVIRESEGKMQESINHAEGEKRAKVLRAEAEAEAQILVAKAEAEAIRQVAAAVSGSGSDPAQYLIAMRYIDTLKDINKGNNTKTVYMPYEASGVLGAVGGIKDLVKLKD